MKRYLMLLWGLLGVGLLSSEAALISRVTTFTDGSVLTHSQLNNEYDEVFDEVNGLLNAANLAATLTMADGDFLDFSASNASSTTDGIRLPQATACASNTAEGQLCWDSDDNKLLIGEGAAISDWNMTDAALMDASPQLVWRDTSDDVAYSWHLDTASGGAPWDYLTLWRGTKTSATGAFNVDPLTPLLHFNSSNQAIFSRGTVQVGNPVAGSLVFYSTTGGRTVTVNPSAGITGSYTLTMPVDDGTANQLLQTDGSGLLSWANNTYVIGNFTRDTTVASGTQAVTVTGITPRYVIFFMEQQNTDEASWGFDDGTTMFTVVDDNGTTTDTYDFITGDSIGDFEVGTGTSYRGQVQSFGSGTMTIVWTRTGAPTGTITVGFMAFP